MLGTARLMTSVFGETELMIQRRNGLPFYRYLLWYSLLLQALVVCSVLFHAELILVVHMLTWPIGDLWFHLTRYAAWPAPPLGTFLYFLGLNLMAIVVLMIARRLVQLARKAAG